VKPTQKKQQSLQAELLAPAGSLEAFFAAMEAGADAVYCGLQSFSARAKAKNFSFQDIAAMTRYVQQRDRKLFVTINTLVKEQELPALIDTLAAVEEAGVDAVILQDLGVWRMARNHFPDLELHASTQMTVHNAAGVTQLEKMGFSRGVLARELTLPEIQHIRSQTHLELEHFIHGALCFCFSGQCYFSSYLGGKSGNRGRCTQPCRRRYSQRGKDGYYFSPNDLSAIELLPALQDAGVSSFKIEGRMKSAEYVSNVVQAYRMVMDATGKDRQSAVEDARKLLKQSFGRTPTKGFLAGRQPTDMATPALRGSTGRYLGEVTRATDNKLFFKSRDVLNLGDRIRIQPGSDKVGTAFTVKQLWAGRKPVKKLAAGAACVSHTFKGRFKPGDAVFKVSSQKAFAMSDAACRRRLQQVGAARQPLTLNVAVENQQLIVCAEVGQVCLNASYDVEMFAAKQSPLSKEALEQVFRQCDDAPFELTTFTTGTLPDMIIPPKRLKEVRRDFYQHLQRDVENSRKKHQAQRRKRALASLVPPESPHPAASQEVTVAIKDIREMRALDSHEIDRILVPLTTAVLHRTWKVGQRQRRGVVWDLPFVIFDQEWTTYQKAVSHLIQSGFTQFRLTNLSHFELFKKFADVRLEASYRLFCLNSEAMQAWQDLGAASNELYIEDDADNMKQVVQRRGSHALYAMVYGSIPLITSRIRIPGLKGGQPLLSDRGDGYQVVSKAGLTVLRSDNDFSLCGALPQLYEMGCSGFLVDISHLGVFTPQGKKVLESYRQRRDLPHTSPFNFVAGME